jgi:hypothetical protein
MGMRFLEIDAQSNGGSVCETMINPYSTQALNDSLLMWDVGFKPVTSIETGLHQFVEWYRQFYTKNLVI